MDMNAEKVRMDKMGRIVKMASRPENQKWPDWLGGPEWSKWAQWPKRRNGQKSRKTKMTAMA